MLEYWELRYLRRDAGGRHGTTGRASLWYLLCHSLIMIVKEKVNVYGTRPLLLETQQIIQLIKFSISRENLLKKNSDVYVTIAH